MNPDQVTVNEITEASDEAVEALARLLPQLSSSSSAPTGRDVAEMVSSPATVLFAASHGGRIVGSLTLAVFRIPTGLRAWIEDVVVDGEMRGKGVGGMLVRAGGRPGRIDGGSYGRPDLAAFSCRSQPPLRPPGFRGPRDERLPIHRRLLRPLRGPMFTRRTRSGYDVGTRERRWSN